MTDLKHLDSVAAYFEWNHPHDKLKAACVRDAIEEIASHRTTIAELLEACQAAIDSGIGSHNHWDDTMRHGAGCPLCIEQGEARRMLRAAIARATGEASR